jgi:hypothetical protein
MAEFGFLGVVVYTRVHTPRFCGLLSSAGTVLLSTFRIRGLRTSWFVVAMGPSLSSNESNNQKSRRRACLSFRLRVANNARTRRPNLADSASG